MRPLLQYEQDNKGKTSVIFYFTYKGTRIELLKARVEVASFTEIKRLHETAQINLNEIMSALAAQKRAA